MKVALHHVTILGRKPQRTLDFYVGRLGFELVWEGACEDNEATPQSDFRLPHDDVFLSVQFYPRSHKGEKGWGFFGGLVLGLPERDWKKELGRLYRGKRRDSGRHVLVDPDGLGIGVEEREVPGVLGLQLSCRQISREEKFWRDLPGLGVGGHELEFLECEEPGALGYGSIHHGGVLCRDLPSFAESSPVRASRWGMSSYVYSPCDILVERVSSPLLVPTSERLE